MKGNEMITKVDTTEAKNRAIELKVDGESYSFIARKLNREGYRTATGKKFNGGTVHWLISPKREAAKITIKTSEPTSGFVFNNKFEDTITNINCLLSMQIPAEKKVGMIRAVLA